MSDISMCQNIDCKLRGKCYRYLAVPSDWQSYMAYEPVKVGRKWTCDGHWPAKGWHCLSLEAADGHNWLSQAGRAFDDLATKRGDK